MQMHSVGIDLGKTTFHLVALGATGKVLVKKKFTQKQLLAFTANLQANGNRQVLYVKKDGPRSDASMVLSPVMTPRVPSDRKPSMSRVIMPLSVFSYEVD